MTKTLSALCVTLLIFMCNSMLVSAAVCSGSSDGVHHFGSHADTGAGQLKVGGTHQYLYGYDNQNNPIYRNDCQIAYYFKYCEYSCNYCGTRQEGSQHEHLTGTIHSVKHN